MIADVELAEFGGEVYRVPREKVSMNTIECAIDLQPFSVKSDSRRRTPRTKNVMFPSLKKYVSCFTNDSAVDGLAPLPGQFVSLGPLASSAGFTPVGSVVIMSEMIELIETTEPPLALDTAGETRGSLFIQDTIRRDMMGEGM
jgi:hypothetical protein